MVDPLSPTDRTSWPVGTLLGALAPRSRVALLALGVERRVPDGEILMREGQPDSYVVLLRQALAKVTAVTSDGRTALLAIRVSGDTVGEMSALNGVPRSATVTACGDARVSVIHRKEFQPFLARHPDVAVQLAAMVSERLRYANRRRVDFTSYPVKVRLARVLAEIATAHGSATPAGIALGVPLKQAELASMCGAAEITVQKALRELRGEGLLNAVYRGLVVLDLPALRHAADLS
jgi:CRP/FNR family transcriptional regulator, cyclic AMP receptor protein